MTRDDVIDLCSGMPGAVEDYPFGESVVVFKVGGRIFALVGLDGDPGSVNLKCDPALALEQRARHLSVRPGYHMNKRHWNSVDFGTEIDPAEFAGMIEHSYELVARALPSAKRAGISRLDGPR